MTQHHGGTWLSSFPQDEPAQHQRTRRSFDQEGPKAPIGSPVQAPALDPETAIALLAELQAMEERLRRLRDGLELLLEEDGTA